MGSPRTYESIRVATVGLYASRLAAVIGGSTSPKDFAKGNSIVLACFDIIRYLTTGTDKHVFCSGKSIHRLLAQTRAYAPVGVVFERADYCKYGFPYMKQTAIWTNLDNWTPRPICCKGCWCEGHDGRKHQRTAQKDPSGHGQPDSFRQSDLYQIPRQLIEELFICIQGRRVEA